jgi:hypothetical protein
MPYFRGQGLWEMAPRNASGIVALDSDFIPFGDMPQINITGALSEINIKENVSGLGKLALSLNTGQELSLDALTRDWSPSILAVALLSSVIDVASVTVSPGSEEPFDAGLVIGSVVRLNNPGKVTSLIVLDSAGSPITLVLNTHYTHDGYGRITFLAIPGTQPYKASYVAGAIKRIPLVTMPPAERWLRGNIINTAARNTDGSFKQMRLDLKKVTINLADTLSFLQEASGTDIGTIPIKGKILADDLVIGSTTVSQYGDLYTLD